MTAVFLSNSARLAARPLTCGGTPTHQWLNARLDASPLDLSDCPEIVVAGAHPDDESVVLKPTVSVSASTAPR